MAQRLALRLLAGVVLCLPIVVGAVPAQQGAHAQRIDFKTPRPVPANLSITTVATADQPARLRFSSESATVDAKGQSLKVTYTSTGLTVEMVSGVYTHTHTVSAIQSKDEGDFKTLYLTFASNGQLMSVRKD